MEIPKELRVEVRETPRALVLRVAEWMTAVARATRGTFRIALAGGSTPEALYALLATDGFRDRFPWDRAAWYLGDERFVPHDHPASNCGMIRRTLLSRVPAAERGFHPIPVDGEPAAAASRYERTLQDAYGGSTLDPSRPLFAICLLGLGADGHTASLFPGEPASEERRRWVVAVPRGRPEARISLTLPALASSRRCAFLVTGSEKAAVVRAIREGRSDAPAARLDPVGGLVWFLDRAAAGSGREQPNRTSR